MKISKCFLNFLGKGIFFEISVTFFLLFSLKNLLFLENPHFSCWIRFLLKISFKDKRKAVIKRETSSISWILSHEYRENFLRSLYIFPSRKISFPVFLQDMVCIHTSIRTETCSESYCNIGWSWKKRSYLFYTLQKLSFFLQLSNINSAIL